MGSDIFWSSIVAFLKSFSLNSVILLVMVFFIGVGAVDKIRGNKYGYGQAFENGFTAMGPLAMTLVGVRSAAPVLGVVIQDVVAPIYERFGASPAVFAATFLTSDVGGYALAMDLAGADIAVGHFAGLIIGSTMGCIMLYDIPVALAIIDATDRPYLACGILLGMITVPLGCLLGGLMMNYVGYTISLEVMVRNLVPVMLVALLIALGLWFCTAHMLRFFVSFGRGVTALITACVLIAAFQQLTGIRLPLFCLMVEPDAVGVVPLTDALLIVGNIALILIGAFPLVEFLQRHSRGFFRLMQRWFGVNHATSAGLIANLASNIPVYHGIKHMDSKGKVMNCAFSACACLVLGDHLGYVIAVNQKMMLPVIVAKLSCGLLALLLTQVCAKGLLCKIGP